MFCKEPNKTGLSISNLYYCRSEVHWGTRMYIAPKQVKVQIKLRQLYLHFEENQPLFVPVPLFFFYTHTWRIDLVTKASKQHPYWLLTPLTHHSGSLFHLLPVLHLLPIRTKSSIPQVNFNQTTEAQSENGYTSTYAPPKWWRYRSICPHARYVRCKSIVPP